MDIEAAKQKIQALIVKYDHVKTEGRISKYNEENTKAEFIEPLFEALGWDVRNTYHPDEVTREEKISKDRVDYSFRINGIPKFFLEAKALRENLDNPKFAEQAINYSWHKGCTWAVLTDFEAVKIFNAEWRTTDFSQNRLKTLQYYEFIDKFDELWLLSRESFEKGLLDKEAEKWGKKTKKSPVDKQLLADFTHFREILSKNMAKLNQNKKLTQEELDEATQRILDRLMFIRFCEDKELEEKKLISNLREWESKGKGQLVKGIRDVYAYFDKLYNSKIFAKHLCDDLEIDNEVLYEVIEGLHYTRDRSISYDFSAIEADVLGNIYEQYLGHILKKTAKTAKLTESQAHRKEQGIYYTPTYIVDYIVRYTLGELLEDKKIAPEKIRILDMACGSGSFLIKAFDVLNEHHMKNDKDYAQTILDVTVDNGTYTKKLKILEKNIFGVDLDRQAVEVAQLNLLLKIAEKGQRLPLLQQNIRQGNSLVESSVNLEDRAFDWRKEFAGMVKEGGFDVIIGNPPYIRQEMLSDQKTIFERDYQTFNSSADIFVYFIEKAMSLLKDKGYLGFVVANRWLRANYGEPLRKWLKQFEICTIIDFGSLRVFQDAKTYPCILIVRKSAPKDTFKACRVTTLHFDSLESYINNNSYLVRQTTLQDSGWSLIDKSADVVLSKIKNKGMPLGKQFAIHYGVKTGLNDAFVIDKATKEQLILEDRKSIELIKPLATGRDIKRYGAVDLDKFIIVIPNGWTRAKSCNTHDAWKWFKSNYPSIAKHLAPFEKQASARYDRGEFWWELRPCDYYEEFDTTKIIYPRINNKPSFTLDGRSCFLPDTAFFISSSSKYLLGILNSRLMRFYSMHTCSTLIGGYYEFRSQYVEQFPIASSNGDIGSRIESLVDARLKLEQKLCVIRDKLTDERTYLEEEAEKLDVEIDALVYKLYGITEDEKKVIEVSLQ